MLLYQVGMEVENLSMVVPEISDDVIGPCSIPSGCRYEPTGPANDICCDGNCGILNSALEDALP